MNLIEWLILGFIFVLVLKLFWGLYKQTFKYQYGNQIAKSKDDPKCKYYPVQARQEFTWEQKKAIADRDKWQCQYKKCNAKLLLKPKTLKEYLIYGISFLPGFGELYINRLMECDHYYIPAGLNGPANEWNGKALCRKHNRRKGNKLSKETFEKLKERGEKIFLPNGYK